MSLNCHYLILFKFPRDSSQISHLAKQMFPGDVKYMQEYFTLVFLRTIVRRLRFTGNSSMNEELHRVSSYVVTNALMEQLNSQGLSFDTTFRFRCLRTTSQKACQRMTFTECSEHNEAMGPAKGTSRCVKRTAKSQRIMSHCVIPRLNR